MKTRLLKSSFYFMGFITLATIAFSSPYAAWENGPPSDPSFFPIAVWLQNPSRAAEYKEMGVNVYIGLWRGPTDEQLDALEEAGMYVICYQNETGLARRDSEFIIGWMQSDEPDNAQTVIDPDTGQRSWGPPTPPSEIIERYERMRHRDSTRPVFLNLGQGVANDVWVGRGSGARRADYLTYPLGCDILSYDVYPVAGMRRDDGENYLHYVPRGIERLRDWSLGRNVIWNCIESTRIHNDTGKPTPHQVQAQVWMSIIHGSMGIIYFVHEFEPQFNEAAVLADPEMKAALTETNRRIHELAPALNSPTRKDLAAVISEDAETPVALMTKRVDDAIYLFAVGMRNAPTEAAFYVHGLPQNATARVLYEDREIAIEDGRFNDEFGAYDARIYRIETVNAEE